MAHLRPEGGKQVTIRAITPEGKAVADCPFVHAVTWNGKPWTRLWIGNAELAEGGELQFTLDDTPPARRQYTQDELPFSLTPYAL